MADILVILYNGVIDLGAQGYYLKAPCSSLPLSPPPLHQTVCSSGLWLMA